MMPHVTDAGACTRHVEDNESGLQEARGSFSGTAELRQESEPTAPREADGKGFQAQ